LSKVIFYGLPLTAPTQELLAADVQELPGLSINEVEEFLIGQLDTVALRLEGRRTGRLLGFLR
jgi:hypothetical protein